MNWRGVIAAAVVIGVISIVVLLPVKPEQMAPPIIDDVEVEDKSTISTSSKSQDSPELTDSAEAENQTDSNFVTDEQGIRHFSFNVGDKPAVNP